MARLELGKWGLVMDELEEGCLPLGWDRWRNRWARYWELWSHKRCMMCRGRISAWRLLRRSSNPRCSVCLGAYTLRNWWACGLNCKRDGWHMRHWWGWSMKVCRWLHASRLRKELAEREKRQAVFKQEREERWDRWENGGL